MVVLMGLACMAAEPTELKPRVFLLDGKHLASARERVRAGDAALMPASKKLRVGAYHR